MEKYAVIYRFNNHTEVIEDNLTLHKAVVMAYNLNRYAIKGSRYHYRKIN